MQPLLQRALDTAASLGASFADARLVRRREETVTIRSGRIDGLTISDREGIGVRVLVDGAWGFAATDRLAPAEIDRVAALAVRIARASARVQPFPVRLDDRPPARGRWETPCTVDPFTVPLEERIADLAAADEAMRGVPGVAFTESLSTARREWKEYAATDGSATSQVLTHTGAAIEANAVAEDEHQRRSWPDAGGGYRSAGYEYVRGLDLLGNAERVGTEAVELLQAPPLPAGRRTIVLDPAQLALQVHESCGHPTELDRVYGTEASFAGTSFLTTDRLEQGFRYGSEIVTLVADATEAGGAGSFGWDDEGVAAQRVELVRNGILVGYQTSRETAPRIGRGSSGGMRADGHDRLPLIRMTNINLQPVPGRSLEEIIAETDDGIYFATNRSWSIDDRRLSFQFATEIAREIRGGKLGRLYRNPTYAGHTPSFWASCDAIGDARSYVMNGLANCGKGEPVQSMIVGHGASGARFRNVDVGVGRS